MSETEICASCGGAGEGPGYQSAYSDDIVMSDCHACGSGGLKPYREGVREPKAAAPAEKATKRAVDHALRKIGL